MVTESQFFIQDFTLACSPEFWEAWQQLPNFNAQAAFPSESAIFDVIPINYQWKSIHNKSQSYFSYG